MNSKSWKTSAAGIGALLVAIGGALTATFDADPTTNADWAAVIAAAVAGFPLATPVALPRNTNAAPSSVSPASYAAVPTITSA